MIYIFESYHTFIKPYFPWWILLSCFPTGGRWDPDSFSGASGQGEAGGGDQEEAGHHSTQRV